MLTQLGSKASRNRLRATYYEQRNGLRDLGISLPPELRGLNEVLGWPAKAVDALADRCSFDGFASLDDDAFAVADLMVDNAMAAVLPQAVTSALINAVSFMVVTPGAAGEPDVLLRPKDAMDATGLWDHRANGLSDALSVTVRDDGGEAVELVWYARGHVTTFRRLAGRWRAEVAPNRTGRVWVVPLVFKQSLKRPFGTSRISRSTMALTDSAMRTLARAETHAEFFAAPQRWALGVEGDEIKDRWRAVMSVYFTATKDEDGDLPQLGQFPQSSMQPHLDHLRTLAALFAAEASLPPTSVGILHDNPSSAEAIMAAKEDLVVLAQSACRAWGEQLRQAVITAVMLRDGLSAPPPELRGLKAKWLNPATPSVVSAADAVSKQVAVLPWLAESDTVLEDLGYDEAKIARATAAKRRAQGMASLDSILGSAGTPEETVTAA
jgi:hypothetical protein